jgi:hypothetical protein
VPDSERERIFGRYFQVEARRASARANRGLGLYFCRLAIEAHGGTIAVEERGEMRTTFVVRVPQPVVVPPKLDESALSPRPEVRTQGEVPPIPRSTSPSQDGVPVPRPKSPSQDGKE